MQLWNNEYPERLHLNSIEDFDLYLNGLANTKHYLLIDDSNKINWLEFYFFERR
ncbi:hypothetical protein RC62_4675 [Flavobacterium aquidurense]|uniref:Uncharacterized protein n=1 Tax=Flavobacterium aquidurense TaxID=362413 RepID=A0A0Q0RVV7_9FLAO|nr:hypothetical protein RC62_4675 [Flavobacterium aquidurense]